MCSRNLFLFLFVLFLNDEQIYMAHIFRPADPYFWVEGLAMPSVSIIFVIIIILVTLEKIHSY